MNETDNKKPSFFKRLFIFGSTPSVMLNCLGMMLATLLVLWLIFGGLLKCYTQHNKTFEIPDFVDMNIEEVKDLASNSRFNFDFSESNYNPRQPLGIIISQDPIPGSRAKNGRTIYLTYNPMEKTQRIVPELYGLKFEYAKSQLINRDFKVNVLKKVIDPDAPGTVQKVSYKGKLIEDKGSYDSIKVEVGETIDLVISEDYNGGSTQVPNLVCLTYSEALFKLRNGHNLMLGDVALDATVTDSTTAYVVGQYPFYAPGEFINIGSQIDLRLSQQKPADCDGGGFGDFQPGDGGSDFGNGDSGDSDAVVPDNDIDGDLDF